MRVYFAWVGVDAGVTAGVAEVAVDTAGVAVDGAAAAPVDPSGGTCGSDGR